MEKILGYMWLGIWFIVTLAIYYLIGFAVLNYKVWMGFGTNNIDPFWFALCIIFGLIMFGLISMLGYLLYGIIQGVIKNGFKD